MNRQELIKLIEGEFSEQRAYDSACDITQFYRAPGGEGYHRATDYTAGLLRQTKADKVWVERYPLDGETKFLGQLMPVAWEPYSAELRVGSAQGKLLVSYENAYSCLPWWTPPTPKGGVTLEVIDVGTGERPEDYKKQNVKGKVVLIRSTTRPNAFAHACTLATEAGVAGMITDCLLYQTAPFRTRESLPNAVQLLRMPSQQYNRAWAIVVDYNAAEHLASLIKKGKTEVFVDIQCRSFKGEAQNLFADIKGTDKSDEYVMYFCHSTAGTRPGANCASGPAMLAEMARTISSLITKRKIARPKRTIRFLANVEGHGSKNYIQNHRKELDKTIAIVGLDSVGHDQRKLKSALLYYRAPDSVPTFVNDFFNGVIEDTPKETRWVFHTANTIPFVNLLEHPYTPWSDNHYYPAFGVPAALFMSWPDLYFHTSLLTPDNLDPQVFRRCGIVTTLAAIELANAGPGEAAGIMREVSARSQFRIANMARQAKGTPDEPRVKRRIEILAQRDQEAVASALVLADASERKAHPELQKVKTAAQKQIAAAAADASGLLKAGRAQKFAAGNVVPKRTSERNPPGLAGTEYWDLYKMSEEMHARDPKMHYDSLRIIADEIWNFSDGQRTVNDIAESIAAEFDFDLEPRHVLKLIQGLEKRGYIKLSKA
ncbi:MAG: hypothetical protein FJ320_12410 [SAR202 cluster bacterium]|nr:hypothetical protein [SAR202 cluster bacterium]